MHICSEKATRQGRMFVHTLAKFDDAGRGLARGCQNVDLRAHFESNTRNLLCYE